jgi:hypothetical protein
LAPSKEEKKPRICPIQDLGFGICEKGKGKKTGFGRIKGETNWSDARKSPHQFGSSESGGEAKIELEKERHRLNKCSLIINEAIGRESRAVDGLDMLFPIIYF